MEGVLGVEGVGEISRKVKKRLLVELFFSSLERNEGKREREVKYILTNIPTLIQKLPFLFLFPISPIFSTISFIFHLQRRKLPQPSRRLFKFQRCRTIISRPRRKFHFIWNLENFEVPGSSDAAGGLEEVEGEFFGEGLGSGGHFSFWLVGWLIWLIDEIV